MIRVAAASGLAQEFRIVLSAKVKLEIVRALTIRVYVFDIQLQYAEYKFMLFNRFQISLAKARKQNNFQSC